MLCDRMMVVFRWLKVVVGDGLVKLFVGMYMVWIDVIEFFLVDVMCFCSLFIFLVSVG